MSLKAFHLVFIAPPSCLRWGSRGGRWMNYFSAQGSRLDLVLAIASAVVAVALVSTNGIF